MMMVLTSRRPKYENNRDNMMRICGIVLFLASFSTPCFSAKSSDNCGVPNVYPNTELQEKYRTPRFLSSGAVVRYNCAAGYVNRGGSPYVQCRSGRWTKLKLNCGSPEEVSCPSPSVPHGLKTSRDLPVYQHGDSVTFSCVEHFHMNGSQAITCGPYGQWEPPPPKCVPSNVQTLVKCSSPTVYPNTEKYSLPGFLPSGTVVQYNCALGYARRGGSPYVQCLSGRWTKLKLICERKSCGSAGEIYNGHYVYEGILFGERATAVCNDGYQLIGRNYRLCLSNGWDGRDPVCEVKQCPPPPVVANGEGTGSAQGPFVYSNVVSYRCLRGQLVGNRDIYCTNNGTWSGSPPECRVKTCPPLNIKNGKVVNNGWTAAISCPRGLRLIGPEKITCSGNGKWLPTIPACVPDRFG